MTIVRAKQIPGWMSDAELQWLAGQAHSRQFIVEIGSYLGRSTRAMADNTSGVVLAYDDWVGPRNEGDSKPREDGQGGSTGKLWTDAERQTLFAEFESHLGDLIRAGKVIPVKVSHENAFPPASGVPIDMAFIDGDHSYVPVYRDVKRWWTVLVPGGLLCGHDIGQHAVREAVTAVLGSYEQAAGTSIWYKVKSKVEP